MDKAHTVKSIKIPPDIKPERLDKYLAAMIELDLSRTFIQRIIARGLVTVDDRPIGKNHRLKGGETVELSIPPPEEYDLSPEDIPLKIEYQDDEIVVINKQPGLVVHPAPGNPGHTLVNALLYHFDFVVDEKAQDPTRPGIVHRLDKDTSGLLLVAKNDSMARKLRRLMSERKITKIYQVVVCGHMPESSGTIDLPIGRSMKDRKKMTVTHVKSRNAISYYKVKERFRLNDLIDIELETGRTHQIRVHLKHLNHPVLGDPDYGGRNTWVKGIDPSERKAAKNVLKYIDRQALHARSLEFTHPVSGEKIRVEGEPPQDMTRLLEFLRNNHRV